MRLARGRQLSERDRTAIERFRAFLRAVATKEAAGASTAAAERAAHVEIYGEQIYPTPATPKGGTR